MNDGKLPTAGKMHNCNLQIILSKYYIIFIIEVDISIVTPASSYYNTKQYP